MDFSSGNSTITSEADEYKAALDDRLEAAKSLANLAINLVGILVAGLGTLAVTRAAARRRS